MTDSKKSVSADTKKVFGYDLKRTVLPSVIVCLIGFVAVFALLPRALANEGNPDVACQIIDFEQARRVPFREEGAVQLMSLGYIEGGNGSICFSTEFDDVGVGFISLANDTEGLMTVTVVQNEVTIFQEIAESQHVDLDVRVLSFYGESAGAIKIVIGAGMGLMECSGDS